MSDGLRRPHSSDTNRISAVVISCVYPESDASEISIGNYIRIFVSAVIVLLDRAESVLIVVAIFVAVRKSVAVVAVALIPALGIVGLLGLRDDNSVLALVAADKSAQHRQASTL